MPQDVRRGFPKEGLQCNRNTTHVVGGDDAAAEEGDDPADAQQLAAQVAQVGQHAYQRNLLHRHMATSAQQIICVKTYMQS